MSVTISVVFDNYSLIKEAITSWGFSCIITHNDKTILFDTGNDGKLLLNNIKEMGFASLDFEYVFISHLHWDHVGGLIDILHAKPDVQLFIVKSALADDIKHLSSLCKSIKQIDGPQELLPGIFSLGDMPGYLNEHAMVIQTLQGLLIITGCAHPGIVKIVETAKTVFPDTPVAMVMGGFHLRDLDQSEIEVIISDLKKLEVQKVAPSHCTGDLAIDLFHQHWGDNFIKSGIGLNLTLPLI